jgi:protein-disulfide isomerase
MIRQIVAILLLSLAAILPGASSWAQPAQSQLAQSQSMPGQSAMPQSSSGGFTAQQRQAIVDIVRQALKSDPSILRDAVTALQADDGARQEAATSAAIASSEQALIHTPGDPVGGNPNGDVTLVEFFDVRCPYCRRMLPVLAELLRRDRNIRLVYKDIPILGPASVLGTRAELAAQKQGGYQKMHDALMAGTPDIDESVVQSAAQRAGLNWSQLQRDMNDPAVQARIDANLQLAHALQVQGTPAYVVGDEMLPGAVALADLQEAVGAARKR